MRTTTRLALLATFGSALTLSSCSTGGHSPSGFLSNYKQLDGGYGTANAVSSYVKPGVDFKKYDSVIIDPVTTVVAAKGISPAITDQLAAYLGGSLHSQLAGGFKIVKAAGPTTLRVRTNLTDVIEDTDGEDPLVTVHQNPKVTLSGNLGSALIAKFVSSVSFEGEVLDSVSGERVTALIDHRLGSKREATPTTAWATVQGTIQQGVGRLRDRFNVLKNR